MTAGYGDPFDGPQFDLDNDLLGAFRAGLGNLHAAAASAGLDEATVDEVVGASWNPFTDFSGRGLVGYNPIVTLATGANGWAWAEAVLVDPRPREKLFAGVTTSGRHHARRHFRRLGADAEAAADDAVTHLGPRMLADRSLGFKVPAWTSPGVVRRNLTWRLVTAARTLDRALTAGDGGEAVMSLNAYFETCGERGLTRVAPPVFVDDASVEAVVWAAALAKLTDRATEMIGGARAGAARDKAALTVDAAKWVLTWGAEDRLNKNGEPVPGSAEEVRQKYAQDSLLVCFHALRATAPTTWGGYPATAVPTREVIAQVAAGANARGDVNADWFARVEARRVEVAKSDRILHGIRRLVETLIEKSAQDTDN